MAACSRGEEAQAPPAPAPALAAPTPSAREEAATRRSIEDPQALTFQEDRLEGDHLPRRLALGPEGNWLVGVQGEEMTWWDLSSGAPTGRWRLSFRVHALRISQDGQALYLCGQNQWMKWRRGEESFQHQVVKRANYMDRACLISERGDIYFGKRGDGALVKAGEQQAIKVPDPSPNQIYRPFLAPDGSLWHLDHKGLWRFQETTQTWAREPAYQKQRRARHPPKVLGLRRQQSQLVLRRGDLIYLYDLTTQEEHSFAMKKLMGARLLGDQLFLWGKTSSELRSGPRLGEVQTLLKLHGRGQHFAVSARGEALVHDTPSGELVLQRAQGGVAAPLAPRAPLPALEEPLPAPPPAWGPPAHNRELRLQPRLAALSPRGEALASLQGGSSPELSVLDLKNHEVTAQTSVGIKLQALAFGAKGDSLLGCHQSSLFQWKASDLSLESHRDFTQRARRCALEPEGRALAMWHSEALTLWHRDTDSQHSFTLPAPLKGPPAFLGSTEMLLPTDRGLYHISLQSRELRPTAPGFVPEDGTVQLVPLSRGEALVAITEPKQARGDQPRRAGLPQKTRIFWLDLASGKTKRELGLFEEVGKLLPARRRGVVFLRVGKGLWVLDTHSGETLMRQTSGEDPGRVLGISPDGSLAVARRSQKLRLFSVAQQIEWATGEPPAEDSAWVRGARAGAHLIISTRSGELLFLDPKTLEPSCQPRPALRAPRGWMAASRDGSLGSITRGPLTELWDLETCRLLRTFPLKARLSHPDPKGGKLWFLRDAQKRVELSAAQMDSGRWSREATWDNGISAYTSPDLQRRIGHDQGGWAILEALTGKRLARIKVRDPKRSIHLWAGLSGSGPVGVAFGPQGIRSTSYNKQGAVNWSQEGWVPLYQTSPWQDFQLFVQLPKGTTAPTPQEGLLSASDVQQWLKEGDSPEPASFQVVHSSTGAVVYHYNEDQYPGLRQVVLGEEALYLLFKDRAQRIPYR